jgi:rSAM/selenodomain-associated transferase 1
MRPLPVQVAVIAKSPVAGRVKTRLCPPLTLAQAAGVARASLMDTLDTVMEADVALRTVVLDGEPEDWLPSKMELIAQRGGPLGDRLSGAIEDLFARLALPVLVIGMDTPQLRTAHLEGAAKALLAPGTDTVLGPAEDGGYWLIGTRRPVVSMFSGVEMSTARTGRQQLSQLRALGLHCARLGRLRDVDLLSDALAVARDVPGSRFAAAIDELVTSPPRSRRLESVVRE